MWSIVIICAIIGAFMYGLPGVVMGVITGAALYALSVILSA